MDDNGFEDAEVGADADFGFDDHDSAALYYKDVRLLVVRNPVAGERDVLAIEVKLAHHKGAKRRPKP